MADKTYLELVNEVLVRLRESTVGSVTDSAYSRLIGSWINDAKQEVEDAWNWGAITYGVSFNLQVDVTAYYLNDVSTASPTITDRARLLMNTSKPWYPQAYDVTTGDPFQLLLLPQDFIREQFRLTYPAQDQNKPIYFGYWADPTGPKIQLMEYPQTVRNWLIYFCSPQADLSNDSDTMQVPWRPVVQIATLLALNERGEEIGEPGTTIEQQKLLILSDAIAVDAANNSDKLIFYPG